MILSIKGTLMEMKKYKFKVHSQETLINLNNYQDFLCNYLKSHRTLQSIIKDLERLDNKDHSLISDQSNEKKKLHYESDNTLKSNKSHENMNESNHLILFNEVEEKLKLEIPQINSFFFIFLII